MPASPNKPKPVRGLWHNVDEPGEELAGARRLPLDQIDPHPQQARQIFDEQKLKELAASIADYGVIEPIVVRPQGDRYEIVAGERRFRAASSAGLTDIPALIREDLDDSQAALLMATENLQREDLDIEDEGRMYDALLAQGVAPSERELARHLGIDRSRINRARRLSQVPGLCYQIRTGAITLRQAMAALGDGGVAHGEPAEEANLDGGGVAHREPPTRRDVAHGEPAGPVVWRPLYELGRRMERWVPTVTRQAVAHLPPARRAELREQIDTLRGQLAQLEEILGDE